MCFGENLRKNMEFEKAKALTEGQTGFFSSNSQQQKKKSHTWFLSEELHKR